MDEWKVNVVEVPGMIGHAVYIYKRSPEFGGMQFITKGGEELVTVKAGDNVPRDGHVFARFEYDQLKALVDEFSRKGFRSANDDKNEGLLEATKYHLEDMRTLVLKKAK